MSAAAFPLPPDLPIPEDDGQCDHLLPGLPFPSHIILQGCDGESVDISGLGGVTVIYCYPMTGRPGVALPDGWDLIPGARGCTPQSCGFKDHFKELQGLGVTQIYGLSTQVTEGQKEAWERLHLPFPLLSDHNLELISALKLPTFKVEVEGVERQLVKRITILVKDGKILHVFYPIFPPNENAQNVVNWLRCNRDQFK